MRVRHKRKGWYGRIVSHEHDLFGKMTGFYVHWEDTDKCIRYSADNTVVVALDETTPAEIEFGDVHVASSIPNAAEIIQRVKIPRQWAIHLMDDPSCPMLEISAPGIAPDTDFPNSDRLFESGMTGYVSGDTSVANVIRHAIVEMGVSAMHEAMEVVTDNGRQVAEPHPKDEEDMWDWMRDKFLDIYDEYLERWPNGSDNAGGSVPAASGVGQSNDA